MMLSNSAIFSLKTKTLIHSCLSLEKRMAYSFEKNLLFSMCKYKKNILSFAVGYRVVRQTYILCLTYKYIYIRHIDTSRVLIMSDVIKKALFIDKEGFNKIKKIIVSQN